MLYNIYPISLALQNSHSLHLSFRVFSFCAIFPGLCSLPPLFSTSQTPLSHHYFSQHMGVRKTLFPALSLIPEWILSLSLTLMNHSLPLRSPIISDRIASTLLMFTKLTIHCQDCAVGYNMAVTHLAEPRL